MYQSTRMGDEAWAMASTSPDRFHSSAVHTDGEGGTICSMSCPFESKMCTTRVVPVVATQMDMGFHE